MIHQSRTRIPAVDHQEGEDLEEYGSRAGHGLLIYHTCLFCNSIRGPWNSVTELFCFGIMSACRLVGCSTVSRVLRKTILSLIRNLNKFQTLSIALWPHVRFTSIFLRWEKDVITTVLQYIHIFYIGSSQMLDDSVSRPGIWTKLSHFVTLCHTRQSNSATHVEFMSNSTLSFLGFRIIIISFQWTI